MGDKGSRQKRRLRPRLRPRPRLRLPKARHLAGVAVLMGLVGAAAMLLQPVDAAVGSDPLLRLRTFDAAPASAGTVDCGPALGDARNGVGGADLYSLARDDACRQASDRRMLSAAAAGAIVLLTGLIVLSAVSSRAVRA